MEAGGRGRRIFDGTTVLKRNTRPGRERNADEIPPLKMRLATLVRQDSCQQGAEAMFALVSDRMTGRRFESGSLYLNANLLTPIR